jgi:hypothetical protein
MLLRRFLIGPDLPSFSSLSILIKVRTIHLEASESLSQRGCATSIFIRVLKLKTTDMPLALLVPREDRNKCVFSPVWHQENPESHSLPDRVFLCSSETKPTSLCGTKRQAKSQARRRYGPVDDCTNGS